MAAAHDLPLPASPLSIVLTIKHQRLWWQVDDEDHMPERWDVSADVSELDRCDDDVRHVGDISLVIADLRRERNMLDSADLGEWALEFIAETVIDPADGLLHPELDEQIGHDGAARMVIVRGVALTAQWRGQGLAAPLLACALRTLASSARLAACRVSPLEFASAPDRVSAELAAVRMGAMLARLGFSEWRGVHVIDLQHPGLLDARMRFIDHWWPNDPEQRG